MENCDGFCLFFFYLLLIFDFSGLFNAAFHFFRAVGLIDAGYRGELMAAVDNIKTEPFTVKRGDRLFQAVAFNGEGFNLQVKAKSVHRTSLEFKFQDPKRPKLHAFSRLNTQEFKLYLYLIKMLEKY